jgi:SAM-dependent methyltransferase
MPDLTSHYASADPGAQTSPPHQQDVLGGFLERALTGKVARALDLGSGRGANVELLSRFADTVVPADVSFDALADSWSRHTDLPLSPTVVPNTGLPFRDAAFNLTVCTEVLEHVEDLHGTGAELERVTASGGVLLVSTPNYVNVQGPIKWWMDRRSGRQDWDPWHAHSGGLERFMTPSKLRATFPNCDIVEDRGADYASALAISFKPLRNRVNKYLLLRPGVGPLRRFGMQYYLLLRRR